MKLGSLAGLPEKATEFNFSLDVGMCEGFNQCKQQYDSLNLTLDVEELADIIQGQMGWSNTQRTNAIQIAQAICASGEVIKVTK